jgi:hypothetical protein
MSSSSGEGPEARSDRLDDAVQKRANELLDDLQPHIEMWERALIAYYARVERVSEESPTPPPVDDFAADSVRWIYEEAERHGFIPEPHPLRTFFLTPERMASGADRTTDRRKDLVTWLHFGKGLRAFLARHGRSVLEGQGRSARTAATHGESSSDPRPDTPRNRVTDNAASRHGAVRLRHL